MCGLIRGEYGNWIVSLAWEKGFIRVILESDSQSIIHILQDPPSDPAPNKLLWIIQEISNRQWELAFHHTM